MDIPAQAIRSYSDRTVPIVFIVFIVFIACSHSAYKARLSFCMYNVSNAVNEPMQAVKRKQGRNEIYF